MLRAQVAVERLVLIKRSSRPMMTCFLRVVSSDRKLVMKEPNSIVVLLNAIHISGKDRVKSRVYLLSSPLAFAAVPAHGVFLAISSAGPFLAGIASAGAHAKVLSSVGILYGSLYWH